MSNQNKTNKANAGTKPVAEVAKSTIVPVCIARLRKLEREILVVGQVPESCQAAQKKIAASITKLADRIHKGLGSEAKKAAKLEAKKVRSDAKTKRDEAKKTKKLAAIKVLKEKLAQMEADVAPVATDTKK